MSTYLLSKLNCVFMRESNGILMCEEHLEKRFQFPLHWIITLTWWKGFHEPVNLAAMLSGG